MIQFIDTATDPIFAYLSWVFYAPRLSANVLLLLKHLLPFFWMGEKEKELEWSIRFQAQLNRRWFELGNDSVWLLSGLMGCFVLTGTLAPIGMYATVVLYAYDVLLASVRAVLEIGRLLRIKKQYMEMRLSADDDTKKEIDHYLQYLNKRIAYEGKRHLLCIMSTTALFFAMCFAIPALASIHPAIPLTGAVLLVLITMVGFVLNKVLEKNKPTADVKKIPKIKCTSTTTPSLGSWRHNPASTSKYTSGYFARPKHLSGKTTSLSEIQSTGDDENPLSTSYSDFDLEHGDTRYRKS